MDIEPHPRTAGWLSGSMGLNASDREVEAILAAAGREASDHRPRYAPATLLLDVKAALAKAGVAVDPDPGQMHVAGLAAADLLRALGVSPVSTTAPELRG